MDKLTKANFQFGDLVKVTWNDAHGSAANVCYDLDEIPHVPVLCESYGILLKMDEVGVSIASEKCDETAFRGYSFVPAGMLVKVESAVTKRKRIKKANPPPSEDVPDSAHTEQK
jgi:hypothetical protein